MVLVLLRAFFRLGMVRSAMPALMGLLCCILGAASCAAAGKTEASETVTRAVHVYGVEFFRSSYFQPIARETVEAIEKAVAPRPVEVKSVTLDELDHLIEERQADVVITISGIYRRHIENGMRDIATLVPREQPDPDHAVGSLILVKKGSGIRTLEDLRGKTIALNTPSSFQGTLTIKKELLDEGYDPETFANFLYIGHDLSKRLDFVRSDRADATFASACVYEREKAQGRDFLQEFDVAAVKWTGDGRCLTSTGLYPNHTILIAPTLDPATVRSIADVVYRMPVNAKGQQWVLASSFEAVDGVYRALETGPYKYLNSWTIERVWSEFGTLLIVLALAVLFAGLHVWRTGRLVRQAVEEIRAATEKQKRITAGYETVRRAVAVANLSNIVAHELGQPLSAMAFYADSLRKMLFGGQASVKTSETLLQTTVDKLIEQTNRTRSIVDFVRSYAKTDKISGARQDACRLLQAAVNNFVSEVPQAKGSLVCQTPESPLTVFVNALEFDLALHNPIKNAWDACREQKDPQVRVACRLQDARVILTVSDNGPALDDEAFERMKAPLKSAKPEGLGLGLSIVRTIVKRARGKVSIERNKVSGITVTVSLPHEKEDELCK